jgi:WD40 repeat protein/energy-coupling factor transporter ATP-binding protein EcfA2
VAASDPATLARPDSGTLPAAARAGDDSPYPGLRPFKSSDAPVFFGRTSERLRLLELLETHRFLAVLGSSGSGKSSLVLSGLVSDLAAGKMLTDEPTTFAFTEFRPGTNPYGALAARLHKGLLKEAFADPIFIEERLRKSPRGLAQLVAEHWAKLAPVDSESGAQRALVVVVDQFEEIFRFAGLTHAIELGSDDAQMRRDFTTVGGDLNEAQAFVDLLLGSARSSEVSIFVVLTMRSDFYNHCEAFEGLPGTISTNQYLTPRMQRSQLEDAIRLPLRSRGWEFADDAVNWILNDLQGESDQLPILQHALARIWHEANDPRQATQPIVRCLTADHYKKIGKLDGALDQHGQQLVENADHPLDSADVARVFRCLGDFDQTSGLSIRRPRALGQVAGESGLDEEKVRSIAGVFCAAEASFLMSASEKLRSHDVLDLSHECLLRKWSTLVLWMEKERQLGKALVRLRECARELGWNGKRNTSSGHLSGGEIARFREAFPARSTYPAPWGNRYQADIESLMRFLKYEEKVERMGRAVLIGLGVLVLVGGVFIWTWFQQANLAKKEAEVARQEARVEAERARDAETRSKEAEERATFAAEKANAAEQKARAEAESRAVETEKLKQQAAADQQKAIDEALRSALGSSGQATAQLRDLQAASKDWIAHVEKEKSSALTPEWKTRFQQLGVLEKAHETSASLTELGILDRNVTLDGYAKQVFSVAFAHVGTSQLALLAGSDRLRSVNLLAPELRSPVGGVVWTQEATMLKSSAFEDSPGWIVASNRGPEFAWSANGEKWISVASGSKGVAQGRLIGGRRIVFATIDGRIGLVGSQENSPAPKLFHTPHIGPINDVIGDSRSQFLLASGDDQLLTLWKIEGDSLTLADQLKQGGLVRSASFNPAGTRVLVPSDEKVIQLIELGDAGARLSAGKKMSLRHDQSVVAGAFSPDGQWVLTADSGGAIYLWRADDPILPRDPLLLPGPDWLPEVKTRAHRDRVTSLAWAPNSFGWVSADQTGAVLLWRMNFGDRVTASPVAMPQHRGVVDALAWASDSSAFATGSADKTVRVQPVRTFIRGKFKTFGGPALSGTAKGELALLNAADVSSPRYSALFRKNATRTESLPARLNPDTLYVAARWDYTSTPREYLRTIKVTLRNSKTGQSTKAQPVDWGPPEDSGKAVDLSEGVKKELDLADGDNVEVEIPLLAPPDQQDDTRSKIAREILKWEGSIRDGRLVMTKEADGRDIAGFGEKSAPATFNQLRTLLEAGRYEDAEKAAVSAIAADTDAVAKWVSDPAAEAYLRDTLTQSGLRATTVILQTALGLPADGMVGASTVAAAAKAEGKPKEFLDALHAARRSYLQRGSISRPGIEDRLKSAYDFASSLLEP